MSCNRGSCLHSCLFENPFQRALVTSPSFWTWFLAFYVLEEGLQDVLGVHLQTPWFLSCQASVGNIVPSSDRPRVTLRPLSRLLPSKTPRRPRRGAQLSQPYTCRCWMYRIAKVSLRGSGGTPSRAGVSFTHPLLVIQMNLSLHERRASARVLYAERTGWILEHHGEQVMTDSGCKRTVAGKVRRREMHKGLASRCLRTKGEPHSDKFRFRGTLVGPQGSKES